MSPASGTNIAFGEGLRLHMRALSAERDALEEEVRQLRACIQIYAEIVRRLETGLALSDPDPYRVTPVLRPLTKAHSALPGRP
jgi:hypothetical protein